jgi:hypothetical protein
MLTHMRAIERKYGLKFWTDERILAGHHGDLEIADAIARADVFVLLVSPEFIESDYIFLTELPAIQQRVKSCRGKVISAVIRECDWEFACGPTQAVPLLNRRVLPIERWRPQNKGFDTARSQIDAAIASHFGLRPGSSEWPRT